MPAPKRLEPTRSLADLVGWLIRQYRGEWIGERLARHVSEVLGRSVSASLVGKWETAAEPLTAEAAVALDQVFKSRGLFTYLQVQLDREHRARRAEAAGSVAGMRVLEHTGADADDEAVMLVSLDGRSYQMRRRDFVQVFGVAAVAPLADRLSAPSPVTDREIAAAVAEARQLAVTANALDLTPADLAWLDQQVAELDTLWRSVPLPTLFHRARALRQEIARFLAGDHSDTEDLRLAALAGTVAGHLAEIVLDLGHYDAAWAHADAGIWRVQGWWRARRASRTLVAAIADGRIGAEHGIVVFD